MSDPRPPSSYTFEVPAYPQVFVPRPRKSRPYWLHLLLLLLTIATTLIVGARLQYNFTHNLPAFDLDNFALPLFPIKWILQNPSRLTMGIPFSATLLGILLAHEFGHFWLCEKNGVYATLPYFVPAPTLIGTFGALIRIKSPIRSRQALFDIGIAGPIAGFLVAVPVLCWGLALSKSMPPDMSSSGLEFGYPLIFSLVRDALAPFNPHPAPLSKFVPASSRRRSLGRNVRHRAEPPARRTIRRRTHSLRGCPARPQVGHAPDRSGVVAAGLLLLGRMVCLGDNSGLNGMASSARAALA